MFQRVFLDECVCDIIAFENQIFGGEGWGGPNIYLSPESQIKQHTDISGLTVQALNELNQTVGMEIAC